MVTGTEAVSRKVRNFEKPGMGYPLLSIVMGDMTQTFVTAAANLSSEWPVGLCPVFVCPFAPGVVILLCFFLFFVETSRDSPMRKVSFQPLSPKPLTTRRSLPSPTASSTRACSTLSSERPSS